MKGLSLGDLPIVHRNRYGDVLRVGPDKLKDNPLLMKAVEKLLRAASKAEGGIP